MSIPYKKPDRPNFHDLGEFNYYLGIRAVMGLISYRLKEDGTNAQSRRATASDIAEELADAYQIGKLGLKYKKVGRFRKLAVEIFLVAIWGLFIANRLLSYLMPDDWNVDKDS